jgi:hypothetical protein
MGVRVGRDIEILSKGDGTSGDPGRPGDGKTKSLLGKVQGGDPSPQRIDHVLGKVNFQRLGTPEKHATLKQGREPPDVVDMAVGDQYGVELLEKIATVPEKMDARFAGIDEQMPSPDKDHGAGEKPVRGGKTRSRAKKADGSHGKRLSATGRHGEGNPIPKESGMGEKKRFPL